MAKKKTPQKSTHIHIRSDQALNKLIRRAAGMAGLTASAWVRERLEEAAKRELRK